MNDEPSAEGPASGRKRRTQAERSETMRLALVNATVEILFERGFAALRLSEIAERAGVSDGALLHHFATKQDLVVASFDYAFAKQLERELAVVEAASRSNDPMRAMVETQDVFFFSPLFMVHTELSAAARAEPALGTRVRPIVFEYQTRRDQAWLDMLVAKGTDPAFARLAVEMTLHLWRGMGLRYFRDPSRLSELKERSVEILRLWRVMLPSIEHVEPAASPRRERRSSLESPSSRKKALKPRKSERTQR
jgi:AcrR family transcriptional regulator